MTGDPWDGRTLEWSTSSPPPAYNFAFTPVVHDNDAWWDMKKRGYTRPLQGFVPIHMPKNTGAGFVLAGAQRRAGLRPDLAHWWLAGLSLRRADRGRDHPHLQLQPRLLHSGRRSRPAPKTPRTAQLLEAMSDDALQLLRRRRHSAGLLRAGRAPPGRTARCSGSGST